MTPHIEAKEGEIANIVLMPGDPKRAEFIAKTYLKDYKLVNTVRGILAFTGIYKDTKVTVMASGMGMPSMGIYSYELYKFYNVETIIRIGSAGCYDENLNVYDVLLVLDSYTDSSFSKVQNGSEENILSSSNEVNQKIRESAKELNIDLHEGRVYSSDVFYKENDDYIYKNKEKKCLAVEMESFALFHNAKILNKNAACILTISDHFITKEETTSEEREKSFTNMIVLALEAARKVSS